MKTSSGQPHTSQHTTLYTIIREPAFDEKMMLIAKNYERLDDLDSAIDWQLARNPKEFDNIEDTPLYLWRFAPVLDGFPQLVIIFRFDEDLGRVTLIDVREVAPF